MRVFKILWGRRSCEHADILESLARLHEKVNAIMRTEQELAADLEKIAAGVDAAVAEVTDLKNQIAALGTQATVVSQDQLDGLVAKADGIVAALSGLTPQA